jgi:hypothetical protein
LGWECGLSTEKKEEGRRERGREERRKGKKREEEGRRHFHVCLFETSWCWHKIK